MLHQPSVQPDACRESARIALGATECAASIVTPAMLSVLYTHSTEHFGPTIVNNVLTFIYEQEHTPILILGSSIGILCLAGIADGATRIWQGTKNLLALQRQTPAEYAALN